MEKAMAISKQLMWKVVKPDELEAGDHIYTYRLHGVYSHHGESNLTYLAIHSVNHLS